MNTCAPVFSQVGACSPFLERITGNDSTRVGSESGTHPHIWKWRYFKQFPAQAAKLLSVVRKCVEWDKRTASFPQLSPPIEAAALLSIFPQPF